MFNSLTFIFILLSFIALISGTKKYSQNQFSNVAYLVLFVTLFVIAGSRYGDRDYFNYVDAFIEAPEWSEKSITMEFGYRYLGLLLKRIGFSVRDFFLFYSFLSVGIMFLFIRKLSPFIFVSVLIYFSHVYIYRDMLQIRAALSIGLAMFSIPYIEKRNFVKTFSILLFCNFFHFVSAFFIIVYFLYPYINSKRVIYTILLGCVFGMLLNESFFEYILTLFDIRLLRLYIQDESYYYDLGLLNPVLIKHIIILIPILYNYDFFKRKVKYFEVYLTSYVMACFFLSAFSSFAIIAARIATLFSNVEHILLPSLMLLNKYRILTLILIITYSFIAFYAKWEEIKEVKLIFDLF